MTSGTHATDPASPPRPGGDAGSLGSASARRPPRTFSWRVPVTVLAALITLALVRTFLVQAFYVPTGSMSPVLQPGDRVLVDRTVDGHDLRRGDIVVVDGTSTFAVADRLPHRADGITGRVVGGLSDGLGLRLGEQDVVKRVIGLPGDRVRVDDRGRLTINGAAVREPYLPQGMGASDTPFDVRVPAGRIWLMGDNRPQSVDSRALLGKPGGGMIDTADLIGRVRARYWPLSRTGDIPSPSFTTTTSQELR